jgi:GNAT superfamily N-acetyltransferase
METLTENYKKTKDDSRYALLVAREGKQVLGSAIGIVCIALDTPFLVVENVIVRQDCRGKGIGRAIFDELDQFAREKNCGYAILASSGYRKGAHKFYEAVGYNDDVRGFRKYYSDCMNV